MNIQEEIDMYKKSGIHVQHSCEVRNHRHNGCQHRVQQKFLLIQDFHHHMLLIVRSQNPPDRGYHFLQSI
jgi:hypothetical protein